VLRDGALFHCGPRQAEPPPATTLRYAPDISLIQINPQPSREDAGDASARTGGRGQPVGEIHGDANR
jgi:hypothetical protein